jgi:hypothetical protein
MMTAEFLALAAVAGQTVVASASTDAWGATKRGISRLLGRGDPQRAQVAEGRLEATREQLIGAAGQELARVRAEQASVWQTRLADLLEEFPELAEELRVLVEQINPLLPVSAVSASGHGVAAGHDVTITASGGGIAAAVIHGNVTPANPTSPGPATP